MTSAAPIRPRGAVLADGVAAAQLRALQAADPCLDLSGVGRVIDWAGPVDLTLVDETAVQAACGIMQVHGRAAGSPAPLGIDYASTLAGVLAAQGVLAATLARARGGAIRSVHTSVAQAALFAVQQYLAVATTDDDWADEEQAGHRPPFVTADGVRFELETFDAAAWMEFWRALGADARAVARGWRPFQQRFGTATCCLPGELHAAARRTAHVAVTAAAARAGVSVLPVAERPAAPVAVPACAVADLPGPVARRPPGVDRAPSDGALPLDGFVVVECTRRIQGPVAGQVLHMLGAEVIRVEPPGGDPMRGMPPMAGDVSARFLVLNAGKRVVEADIKSPAGRRAVCELVATADVFVHNWAPGKAEQLGLDAADLLRVRPDLVYGWASGWGDVFGASPPLGTEYLVQAASGLAAAVYPRDEPSAPSLMTLTDILGGLVSALGVLAALLRAGRTRRGARVDSSLFSAAGVVPRPPRRPRWSLLDRPLRTADGYLALPRNTGRAPVAAALGLPPGCSPEELVARCRAEPGEPCRGRLAEAGVVATPVCTDLRTLAEDPRFGAALRRHRVVSPRAPWEFA